MKKRFKIDDKRILLRGFSMGGEGAWHIALHYPGSLRGGRNRRRDVVAPRRRRRASQPYQYATLKIWENMEEWALNAFNLPLAGHDGDTDTQIASLPGPPPGTPNRGQLESSLRTRAQLEKEGFPSEGEPDFLRLKGTPDIFLISQNTGHGTSPLVRQRLDAFLKEWGDKGQTSPDHIRFVTYTTRYNRDYWVSVDGLDKHYERADIDAQRAPGGDDVRDQDAQRVAPGAARDRSRQTGQDRRADAEGEIRPRDHAGEDGRSVEGGEGGRLGGPAQDARAAGADRRCVPRSLPAGASHRHAVERCGEPAGAARTWRASTGCGASTSAAIRS